MSKVKKLMAMLMAVVMTLGMSVTAFAAIKTNATITVIDDSENPLELYVEDTKEDGVNLSYAQVIVPDRKTTTGWAFVGNTSSDNEKNLTITNAFIEAFKTDNNAPSDQDVINTLIGSTKDRNNIATSNTTQIADALSKIAASNITFTTVTTNPFTVNSAGVYVIKASQTGYTYNTMAAYVGFGKVTIEGSDEAEDITYEYPSLVDVQITAKRAPETITKSTTDEDKLSSVDSIVTYTIEAYVPFIDPNDENKYFGITDSIYGAEYYLTGDNSVAEVKMGDDVIADADDFIVVDGSFDIDLSDLITDDNADAGKKITVIYTAKVNGETVRNTSASHVGNNHHDSDPVEIYTGRIVLTKTDEDDDTKLAGAGFEVRKNDVNAEPLTFTELGDGDYIYDAEGAVTEVFTGTAGTLTIRGLDIGTYLFKETTAPEGYHIANNLLGYDAEATIEVENGVATAIIEDTTELTNTKLASLPSTGGIGTTIFTIGGCVIMVTAAGLYFATRKKEHNA